MIAPPTDAGTAPPATVAAHPGRRWRSPVAWLLVALTCLAIPGGMLAVTVQRTLADTDRWVAAAAALGRDPVVVDALGAFLADEAARLLDGATPSRSPLAAAGKTPVRAALADYLRTDAAQRRWQEAVRAAHPELLRFLRDRPSALRLEGDRLSLNLLPQVADALRWLADRMPGRLGSLIAIPPITAADPPAEARRTLSAALGVPLPADFGQAPVGRGDDLAAVRDAVRALDLLAWALPALVAPLLAAALAAARDRRRALLHIAGGAAIACAVALIVARGLPHLAGRAADGGVERVVAMAVVGEVASGVVGPLLGGVGIASLVAIAIVAAGRRPPA
jgi:hypothetical protein